MIAIGLELGLYNKNFESPYTTTASRSRESLHVEQTRKLQITDHKFIHGENDSRNTLVLLIQSFLLARLLCQSFHLSKREREKRKEGWMDETGSLAQVTNIHEEKGVSRSKRKDVRNNLIRGKVCFFLARVFPSARNCCVTEAWPAEWVWLIHNDACYELVRVDHPFPA